MIIWGDTSLWAGTSVWAGRIARQECLEGRVCALFLAQPPWAMLRVDPRWGSGSIKESA